MMITRSMFVSCGRCYGVRVVDLSRPLDANESGALFQIIGEPGALWVAREKLPRREQLAAWPDLAPIPVKEWPGSGLVEVGEPVAEAVADDFAGLVPPATWTYSLLQVGEAMDHNGPGGVARYLTFRREASQPNTGWVYAGILPKGVSA
jgi:hypothetical protein